MNAIVIYKSKYGSAQTYARWIAEALGCTVKEARQVKAAELSEYDTVIYGGGLYAEVISGVSLITKNMEKLKNSRVIVFTTGITPLSYREYYDKMVIEKNFSPEALKSVKVFNFLGKMVLSELSPVHRAALKTLKKIMSAKENPTEMEKLLIDLCDADGDFCDKSAIAELVEYAKA